MDWIRDLVELFKRKQYGEAISLLRRNKKLLEKGLLAVLILVCLGTFIIGDKDDEEPLAGETLSGELTETAETADMLEAGEIYVDVQGAVNNPGVVKLKDGSRVFQAIEAAGGIVSMADIRPLNQAQILNDGDKLYVPFEGEITEDISGSLTINGNNSGKININTATSEELQSLNGIGIVTAGKIIDYRTQNGRFSKLEDLKNVSGIGDKTFENIKDDICI